MYKFKRANGKEARIYFSHVGGKSGDTFVKGQPCKPGRPPRYTKCFIVGQDGKLLAKSQAAPITTILEELPAGFTERIAQKFYGRRFKKITVGDDGKVYAVLKGDIFSRAIGRKESLKKALAALPRVDRLNAWVAIGEVVVEEDSVGCCGGAEEGCCCETMNLVRR